MVAAIAVLMGSWVLIFASLNSSPPPSHLWMSCEDARLVNPVGAPQALPSLDELQHAPTASYWAELPLLADGAPVFGAGHALRVRSRSTKIHALLRLVGLAGGDETDGIKYVATGRQIEWPTIVVRDGSDVTVDPGWVAWFELRHVDLREAEGDLEESR